MTGRAVAPSHQGRDYISAATSSCIARHPPNAITIVAPRPLKAPILRSAPSGNSTVRNTATSTIPTKPSQEARGGDEREFLGGIREREQDGGRRDDYVI